MISRTSTVVDRSATQLLVSARMVALDTETTGLDVNKDRMIQIGAVRFTGEQVLEGDKFESFVDPGIEIPPASTEIHGITAQDLRGAPSFPDLKSKFDQWLGHSVVVGFATGFDLAILRREHQQASLEWRTPRFLDVAMLARQLLPTLPDYSLDTIAARLEIDIQNRHTATGDALAAAKVFIALMPAMRVAGIRTIAEAERACHQVVTSTPPIERTEWEVPGVDTDAGAEIFKTLAQLDLRLYRQRVADVMHVTPALLPANATVGEALSKMMDRSISSVFVEAGPEQESNAGGVLGILTERDILRAINREGYAALQDRIDSVCSYPLQTIESEEFAYRAASKMTRLGFRHLAVRDAEGKIVGALSARDLLKEQESEAIDLDDGIDNASNVEQLGYAWAKLAPVARQLFTQGVDARDIASVISHELCALTRRACEIAETELNSSGHGGPPVGYAVLVLGSGGRGESLMAMDQDNAIVYEHGAPGEEVDRWFARLGARVSEILDLVGVPYCKGGVMGMNSQWRRSVAHWQQEVSNWVIRHHPEDILNTDIFYDAKVVHGDSGVGNQVLEHAFRIGRESREFLSLLKLNACNFDQATGFLGRLKLEEGRVDVKKSGLLPIFSAARVLAIQHQIRERSTRDRFKRAMKMEYDSENSMQDVYETLLEAHSTLLEILLRQQLEDMHNGIPPSNNVAPSSLSAPDRQRLKWALQNTSYVSNLLGDPLGVM